MSKRIEKLLKRAADLHDEIHRLCIESKACQAKLLQLDIKRAQCDEALNGTLMEIYEQRRNKP